MGFLRFNSQQTNISKILKNSIDFIANLVLYSDISNRLLQFLLCCGSDIFYIKFSFLIEKSDFDDFVSNFLWNFIADNLIDFNRIDSRFSIKKLRILSWNPMEMETFNLLFDFCVFSSVDLFWVDFWWIFNWFYFIWLGYIESQWDMVRVRVRSIFGASDQTIS